MRSLHLACLPSALAWATKTVEYAHSGSYMGKHFFDLWDFYTEEDPSHGHVQYVDRQTATAEGMIAASSKRIYLGTAAGNSSNAVRRSVRVESKAKFNGGLFIVSIDHVPTGCGTWPAFWMYGEDARHSWPKWGEYDIIEGVHESDRVLTSLHTSPHCDQTGVHAGRDFLGKWDIGSDGRNSANNCSNVAPDQWYNQGCPQRGPSSSFGPQFNVHGGGTYAAEWNPVDGRIQTWFWPFGAEPADVVDGRPDPSGWEKPYSFFVLSPKTCPAEHFVNMRLVFNINFCGDLGNALFKQGCPQFKHLMCPELVSSNPDAFTEAYWAISRFDLYEPKVTSSWEPLFLTASQAERGHLPVPRDVATKSGPKRGFTPPDFVSVFFLISGALILFGFGAVAFGPLCLSQARYRSLLDFLGNLAGQFYNVIVAAMQCVESAVKHFVVGAGGAKFQKVHPNSRTRLTKSVDDSAEVHYGEDQEHHCQPCMPFCAQPISAEHQIFSPRDTEYVATPRSVYSQWSDQDSPSHFHGERTPVLHPKPKRKTRVTRL